ncbi:TylF/MycF/NovP-related O-methyltransferase [Eisenibacter elegans]|jgi:predicted O-methyltransferase YrrM|uniref:TylF/MycF/NovP-related O-methyltransferase n=1 Tax=Eisenibacter elegans TaxID=997 RepID=UPI00040404B2|nr:TylF/MycF/NovP-related O-methyltransferase [Eisenibacter elegans]
MIRHFWKNKRPPEAQPSTPASQQYADFSTQHWQLIRQVQPYTMTSPERLHQLLEAVWYLEKAQIPGAMLECGVWKGGSMMAIAYALLHQGALRPLYLCDTFCGMPSPLADEHRYDGIAATTLYQEGLQKEQGRWLAASLTEVQANLAQTAYPSTLLHWVEGDILQTLPTQAPEQLALLRLDTDWYSSTKHALETLYPRLASGGVLIIDDYGHWQGCRRAVDEYFAQIPVFWHRVDYTCRMLVKP